MDLYIAFCCLIFVRLVNASQTLSKTKMNETRLLGRPGNRTSRSNSLFSPGSNIDAHVQPLPEEPTVPATTYTKLYQGVRYKDDQRVFLKRFEYEATSTGQQIVCQGVFDCVVAFLAIESTEGIPVLVRGGAGYRHVTAVVKAKPYKELKGQVRAYCRNKYVPLGGTDNSKVKPKRRFYFGDFVEENESS